MDGYARRPYLDATTRSVKLATGEGEHFDTAAFQALIRAAVALNTTPKPKRTNT